MCSELIIDFIMLAFIEKTYIYRIYDRLEYIRINKALLFSILEFNLYKVVESTLIFDLNRIKGLVANEMTPSLLIKAKNIFKKRIVDTKSW